MLDKIKAEWLDLAKDITEPMPGVVRGLLIKMFITGYMCRLTHEASLKSSLELSAIMMEAAHIVNDMHWVPDPSWYNSREEYETSMAGTD